MTEEKKNGSSTVGITCLCRTLSSSQVDARVENCVQICHPYVLTSLLDECEHFRKGRDICNQVIDTIFLGLPVASRAHMHRSQTQLLQLYGDGCFALDCSQILVKFPKTATETPWHQVVGQTYVGKGDDRW